MKLRSSRWYGLFAALALFTSIVPAGEGGPAERSWPLFRGGPSLDGVSTAKLDELLQPLWVFEAGDAIESAVTVEDGTVFLGSLDGSLYALSLDTGKQLWRYDTDSEIKAAPAVSGGKVFVGDASGVLHAVDARSGRLEWQFRAQSEIASSVNFGEGKIVFGSHDENIYCLSSTGQLEWKVATEGYVYGTPALDRGRLVSAGCDGFLRVLSLADGSLVRQVELGGYVGASAAVAGGRAFVGSFENQVLAIDLDNGAVAWRYEAEDRQFPYFSSAAVDRGIVIVGGRDKRVHAIDAASGRQRWLFNAGGKVDSSPVISGERVFVGSASGEIFALQLQSGQPVWRFDTGSAILASPAVAAGRLLIGNSDGQLYCFGPAAGKGKNP